MANFISNMVKNGTDMDDAVIANSMMGSAKAAADAYLNATMLSATPELRAMYASSLNQIIAGHSALVELTVNRDWEKPYNSPVQQLAEAYDKSKDTV
ncbi:spore coat protein [Clostridium sp. CX1]|uniref:Spore coat protein n=1 Tax=Clostridium tanneri TaxID=3037988 RepID=A0ABU4JRN7_9CLOT|nr:MULTISPECIES: spore coat protein [unclassified Clostridium]MCT8977830.1 spore coat protein [Clostridium sp. CX1]MDW8800816.1 spore coat protein [Clostridium sp. A1-XYC3]